jgi:hypothetical protein
MARRLRHLLAALLVLGACVGASAAYAAWSATASTPSSTFTSKADWVAPVVSGVVIHKASAGAKQGYFNGYVKTSGTYFVYADVAESGNPASGFAASNPVTASLTNLGGSATGALTSGSCSSQGVTYNWCGGPFTVSAGTTAGSKTYTLTTTDQVPNSATTAAQSVTVDNTVPAGTTVQTANAGTTAGKAEQNDTITFTFNDVIDPESVLSGWTGTSTPITVRFTNNTDRLQLWNSANTAQLTSMGQVTMPNNNYVSAAMNFTGSTMALDTTAKTITVTLGTPSAPASVGTGGSGTMSWAPATVAPLIYDRAGNNMGTGAISETGAGDVEF